MSVDGDVDWGPTVACPFIPEAGAAGAGEASDSGTKGNPPPFPPCPTTGLGHKDPPGDEQHDPVDPEAEAGNKKEVALVDTE